MFAFMLHGGGIVSGFATLSELKRRGWTDGLIRKLLGDCDELARNPKFRYASPMKLYKMERVKAAELKPEFLFKPSSKARKAGAVKAVRTKTEKIRQWASTVPIKYSFPQTAGQAMTRGRASSRYPESGSDERHAVNYLRHECSTYDNHLAESFGTVGTNLAHAIIKNRILLHIAESFPELEDEANTQMINENGLEPRSARNKP